MGFQVTGLGFSGLRFWVQAPCFRVLGVFREGFRDQGHWVWVRGFRVKRFGLRRLGSWVYKDLLIWGFGFRVSGFGVVGEGFMPEGLGLRV